VPTITALINGLGATFDDHGFGVTWRAKLARVLYGLSLRSIDTIVFQNADDPKLLSSLGLLSHRANWRVVPGSGVDVEKLEPAPPHDGQPTFTLVSRLIGSKGIRDFVSAARTIRTRYSKARFVLAGQLEDHPDAVTREEIAAWVAAGLIDYIGFTVEVPALLAETTVFVLPSYYREGVPRTNLEAMAMARAVVTTDWVGCRETVEDGVNGFLVAPKDPAALAERLERYLRDPALAIQHGREGRKIVERRFDIRLVNELMLDALGLR
jgi:glycosyltransferase involved in cell wall biosynthesis